MTMLLKAYINLQDQIRLLDILPKKQEGDESHIESELDADEAFIFRLILLVLVKGYHMKDVFAVD